MAIEANGRKYSTLSDNIYVNGKKVQKAYANGNLVYPEGGSGTHVLIFGRNYIKQSHTHEDGLQPHYGRESGIVHYGSGTYEVSLCCAASVSAINGAGNYSRFSYERVGDNRYFNFSDIDASTLHYDNPGYDDSYTIIGFSDFEKEIVYGVVRRNGGGSADSMPDFESTIDFSERNAKFAKLSDGYRIVCGAAQGFFNFEFKYLYGEIEPGSCETEYSYWDGSSLGGVLAVKQDPQNVSVCSDSCGSMGTWYFGKRPAGTEGFIEDGFDVAGLYVTAGVEFESETHATVNSTHADPEGSTTIASTILVGYVPITDIIYIGDDPHMASIDRIELVEDGEGSYSYNLLY